LSLPLPSAIRCFSNKQHTQQPHHPAAAQIADGYFVKYFASTVSLLVYAGPIYFMDPRKRGSQGQLTADYIRRCVGVVG
jgi:hypothetical protein